FFYAALFQFSDVLQVTAAGALRGYQDTRMTMLFTLFAYWAIGLPIGYVLGLTDHPGTASGLGGLCQGLSALHSCAAVLLSIRLARSARRTIRTQGRAKLHPERASTSGLQSQKDTAHHQETTE